MRRLPLWLLRHVRALPGRGCFPRQLLLPAVLLFLLPRLALCLGQPLLEAFGPGRLAQNERQK